MGVPDEAQLIVPTHRLFSFDHPPIICLAGKTGVGKSVVARYLAVFCGFQWCKTRNLIGDLLVEDAAIPTKERMFDRQVDPESIRSRITRLWRFNLGQISAGAASEEVIATIAKRVFQS